MIGRLIPHPRLSIVLALLWLLLANAISFGQVLLGIALGLAIGLAASSTLPAIPVVRAPLKAASYLMLVLRDIVVANLEVAQLVVGPLERLRPRIVAVPLDIDDPVVAAVLAATVTLTPGTVSVDLDVEASLLVVHVLNAADDQSVIDGIKSRYEARLKEIFRC
jgi:multicomponent K+:H+ antiporter subunit E